MVQIFRLCECQRQDFTRYSASEAEELENLDGVGHLQRFSCPNDLKSPEELVGALIEICNIYIYYNIELYKLTCNAFGVAALRWREWVEASQRWCIQKTRSSRNLHGGVCIWLPFGMHRLHCAHFCDMQFVPRCDEGHLFAMIASPEWRTEQI